MASGRRPSSLFCGLPAVLSILAIEHFVLAFVSVLPSTMACSEKPGFITIAYMAVLQGQETSAKWEREDELKENACAEIELES